MYDLVIVWENGDKDIYKYDTKEHAQSAGDGMKTALGDQIQWYGVRNA